MIHNSSTTPATGQILVLLRPSWIAGVPAIQFPLLPEDGSGVVGAIDNGLSVYGDAGGRIVYRENGDLDMGGRQIVNAGGVTGVNGRWRIGDDGILVTRIKNQDGNAQNLYSLSGISRQIILHGSSALRDMKQRILFEPAISAIIDPSDMLTQITPVGSAGRLLVVSKDAYGFAVSGDAPDIQFDWLVIADRKHSGSADPSPTSTQNVNAPLPTTTIEAPTPLTDPPAPDTLSSTTPSNS